MRCVHACVFSVCPRQRHARATNQVVAWNTSKKGKSRGQRIVSSIAVRAAATSATVTHPSPDDDDGTIQDRNRNDSSREKAHPNADASSRAMCVPAASRNARS